MKRQPAHRYLAAVWAIVFGLFFGHPSYAEDPWQTGLPENKSLPLKSGPVIFDFIGSYSGQGYATGTDASGFNNPGRFDARLFLDGEKMGLWKGFSVESTVEYRVGDDYPIRGGVLTPPNTASSLPIINGDILGVRSLMLKQKLSDKLIMTFGRADTIDAEKQGYGMTRWWNVSFTAPPIHAMTTPPVTPMLAGVTILGGKKKPTFNVEVMDNRSTPTLTGLDDLFSQGMTIAPAIIQPVEVRKQTGRLLFRYAYTNSDLTAFDSPYVLVPPSGLQTQKKHGSWEYVLEYEQRLGMDGFKGWKPTSAFVGIGQADAATAPFSFTSKFGVNGTSPLAKDSGENWGVGFFFNHTSKDFKGFLSPVFQLQSEPGFEAYCNVHLTKFLAIGGDVQVIQPGIMERTAQNPRGAVTNGVATLLGVRMFIKY
jgi:porin